MSDTALSEWVKYSDKINYNNKTISTIEQLHYNIDEYQKKINKIMNTKTFQNKKGESYNKQL